MKVAAGFAVWVLLAGAAHAQHQHSYSGEETRSVKALSDQQIADLKEGRGMGLALAAELNGYPGPRHAIDLAEPLKLTRKQLTALQALLASMKAETVPIGEMLISQEAELDRQFASKTISPESLAAMVHDIGATQADLRTAHLKYHLTTLTILSPEQAKRYAELRGYALHEH